MADAYSIIRDAIVAKHQIVATYRGHRREMCPHVLGTKDGRVRALFYQFGGSSSSGLADRRSVANWRCIPLDQLEDVEVRDGPWYGTAAGTSRQTCVDHVDVEAFLVWRPD